MPHSRKLRFILLQPLTGSGIISGAPAATPTPAPSRCPKSEDMVMRYLHKDPAAPPSRIAAGTGTG